MTFDFKMKSKIIKIKLISENICFGPKPAFTEEVYQTLSIFNDGRIYFRSYQYGQHKLLRSKYLKLSSPTVDEILNQIEQIINTPSFRPLFATDVGIWTMKVSYGNTNREFTGSLATSGSEFDQLSDELRALTKIDNLFAFDAHIG